MGDKTVKYIKWAFWNCYYTIMRPRTVLAMIPMMERCRAPWWKWKPSVWHNEHGRMWHVTLSDESYYVESRQISADVYISQETGNIIGMNLFDEQLRYGNSFASHKGTSAVNWLNAQTCNSPFVLVSPAGGKLEISEDDRRRIVACMKHCEYMTTDELEALNRD